MSCCLSDVVLLGILVHKPKEHRAQSGWRGSLPLCAIIHASNRQDGKTKAGKTASSKLLVHATSFCLPGERAVNPKSKTYIATSSVIVCVYILLM